MCSTPHLAIPIVALSIGILAPIFTPGPAAVVSAASPFLVSRPAPPAPPRTLLDTTLTPQKRPPLVVRAGGDFQAALEAAQPGDVISLEAGAVFRGNFILPQKAVGDWIVVRSSASDASLPSPGTRITPAFASSMPKLVTPNSVQVVQTAPGASRYRFIGIEFTVSPNVKTIRQIIAFGGLQSTIAATPSQLVLDRCYVHGQPTTNVFRGVLLNSASSAVIDSHVSDIHVAGYDSQAILAYNGPGPFKIVNNYLEAAGENLMFGGGDPRIPDLVPSDIEIRHNHLVKPLKWRQGTAEFVGIQWTIKNLLELKNAQRVLVEGNVLENVWAGAQGGAAVVLTPRSGGRAPWSVVQDVMFRNNIVKNAVGGLGVQSTDNGHPSGALRRIAIVNNLWLSIDRVFITIAVPSTPLEDFVVDHNTAIPTRYFSHDLDAAISPALVRFQFTNNLTGFGTYGVKFPRTAATLARWSPAAIIAKNALVALGQVSGERQAGANQPWGLGAHMYMVLPSAEAAGLSPGGTLSANGILKGAGTDGRDIGVDFEELERVTGIGHKSLHTRGDH